MDLKGGPPETPDVFIVPSRELSRLLNPDYAGWCDIEEEDEQKYKNCWDVIDNALAQNTECHA